MKKDLLRSIVTALSVAPFLAAVSPIVIAQEPRGVNPAGGGVPMTSLEHLKAKSSRPAPRTPDGKPNLSGLWGPDGHFIIDISAALKPGEKLPLQPWALKLTEERLSKPGAKQQDPKANCLPDGVPREDPFPWRIIQTPQLIVFLFEGNVHSYRQIFMDGSHPKDLDPLWYGDSRGRWDGDTLVVDTVGFNDKSWFDGAGHPHTEKLHVIERYRRPDSAHLEFEVTIDDPGAYTRPFTLFGHSPLLENTEIMEYFCVENGAVDVSHMVGPATVGVNH
jgi:hypothetical protein